MSCSVRCHLCFETILLSLAKNGSHVKVAPSRLSFGREPLLPASIEYGMILATVFALLCNKLCATTFICMLILRFLTNNAHAAKVL